MLKPSDANTKLADLLGKPVTAAAHLTRRLREADGNFWPQIGTGRRGSVMTRHLVCAVIADGCVAGQPSDAPRVLAEFQSLRRARGLFHERVSAPANSLMSYALPVDHRETTFSPGSSNESLIDLLCKLIRMKIMQTVGVEGVYMFPLVRITLGSVVSPMTADIEWPFDESGKKFTLSYLAIEDSLPGLDLQHASARRAYRSQILIGEDEILGLASIAVSTGEYSDFVQSAPGDAPAQPALDLTASDTIEGETTPETTKAAEPASPVGPQVERPATRTALPHRQQTNPNTASKQSASCMGIRESQGFHQPALTRTYPYGSHWNDAAAA